MADKKLTGKELIEQLKANSKNKDLLLHVDFQIVGQKTELDVEDTSIVVIKKINKRVLCSFSYDTNGLIYAMSFGSISFSELCDFTDLIKSVLEDYNY